MSLKWTLSDVSCDHIFGGVIKRLANRMHIVVLHLWYLKICIIVANL